MVQVGEKEIGLLMLAGVRVGGTPYLPTPFRWGYGWDYPRFYAPLNEKELKQVEKLDNISVPKADETSSEKDS